VAYSLEPLTKLCEDCNIVPETENSFNDFVREYERDVREPFADLTEEIKKTVKEPFATIFQVDKLREVHMTGIRST